MSYKKKFNGMKLSIPEYKFSEEKIVPCLKKLPSSSLVYSKIPVFYNGVENNIFITGLAGKQQIEELEKNKITHILQVCKDNETKLPSGVELRKIEDLEDIPITPGTIHNLVDDALNWLADSLTGTNILVHCHMGYSRAPGIVVAFLIKFLGMDTEDAISLVKQIRPVCSPSRSIINAYAKKL